ncbi:DUF2062 domain-containing protein [Sphingomonas xanthus]|uniref:DUF2062 domain-containing protein n=1 Tax=Sphingomonas xanthus TaxID=2594473 RepID=A0A516ITT2_9SPHN|nr:DUF2062 domain-containing protein [Sphingomonas xanthus]QDP20280.1 DUF2062 domain-containing protein [Sphingomonas xanthus]
MNFWQRFLHRHAPSREEVLESRWLRPFGARIRHSELWRFTRRSVPRAVFAGTFIGIFLMIPGLQIVGAALLSMPMRANIPIAAAMTFLSNPITTPFFLLAAIQVGNRIGFQADLQSYSRLNQSGAGFGEWMGWLWSDAAPALVSGLFLIGLGLALLGYVVSLFGWRWWIGRKWKQRVIREA